MQILLESLTTPPTAAEWRQSIYNVLSILGVNTTVWRPYSVLRALITAVAITLAGASHLVAAVAKAGFLDLATGAWLTLTAYYVFGVARITATFASGDVTLTNSGGGTFNVGVDDLIVKCSSTGKTYRNTEAFSLAAGQTVDVAVQAIEAGSESSAAAGEIDDFVTPLIGVTVTNDLALVGLDEETDAQLRIRCREKPASLSPNGPADAYAYFARTALLADGSPAGVNRVRTSASGNGVVTVYVTTATGGASAEVLAAVDSAIQQNVVPLGVNATVAAATIVPTAVTYSLWCYSNIAKSNAQIATDVESALENFFAAQPIGGNIIAPAGGAIYLEAIEAAIMSAIPAESRIRVTLTLPAVAVSLAVSQVASLGAVTATITQLTPPTL